MSNNKNKAPQVEATVAPEVGETNLTAEAQAEVAETVAQADVEISPELVGAAEASKSTSKADKDPYAELRKEVEARGKTLEVLSNGDLIER